MTIKHIVLSGGGPAGLVTYGAVRELAIQNVWQLKNIKTIYGTSIGAIIGIIISLGYEWKWIDDYILKRPWEKVADIGPHTFFEAFKTKGILTESFIESFFTPLFTAKGLDINITLKEFYDFANIEHHIFTTKMNGPNMKTVDLSKQTHPDLSVVKAVTMSAAYPFIFAPVFYDNDCYLDGGLLNNFPIQDCLYDTKSKEDEVLSFKNKWITAPKVITEDTTIVEYFIVLMHKLKREGDTKEIKNTVRCLIEDLDGYSSWHDAIQHPEKQMKFIEKGKYHAQLFMEYTLI